MAGPIRNAGHSSSVDQRRECTADSADKDNMEINGSARFVDDEGCDRGSGQAKTTGDEVCKSDGSVTAVGNRCTVCDKLSTMRCSGCKQVYYCGGSHQGQDWKRHRVECKDFMQRQRKLAPPEEESINSSVPGKNYGAPVVVPSPPSSPAQLTPPEKILFNYGDFVQLFEWDRMRQPPVGLINCGNSCFANAALQCLTYTRPLTAFLLYGGHVDRCRKREWCFLCELKEHVERARQSTSPFSAVRILSRIRSMSRQLVYGRQEDVHEFVRFAIDSMQSICLEEAGGEKSIPPRVQETTLIHHIFGGHFRSQIQCMTCGYESNVYESMMDLSLEILSAGVESLEQALEQFTAPEYLDGDNAYRCDKCKKKVRATKRLTVHEAPNILTITLKRFTTGRFGKLNKRVTFPEVLDMSPYTSGEQGDINPPPYKLYGVIVHVDMLNSSFFGHYVCYVKDSLGRWFKIDDQKVKEVAPAKVMAQRAYMLFYTRSGPRPCAHSDSSAPRCTIKLAMPATTANGGTRTLSQTSMEDMILHSDSDTSPRPRFHPDARPSISALPHGIPEEGSDRTWSFPTAVNCENSTAPLTSSSSSMDGSNSPSSPLPKEPPQHGRSHHHNLPGSSKEQLPVQLGNGTRSKASCESGSTPFWQQPSRLLLPQEGEEDGDGTCSAITAENSTHSGSQWSPNDIIHGLLSDGAQPRLQRGQFSIRGDSGVSLASSYPRSWQSEEQAGPSWAHSDQSRSSPAAVWDSILDLDNGTLDWMDCRMLDLSQDDWRRGRPSICGTCDSDGEEVETPGPGDCGREEVEREHPWAYTSSPHSSSSSFARPTSAGWDGPDTHLCQPWLHETVNGGIGAKHMAGVAGVSPMGAYRASPLGKSLPSAALAEEDRAKASGWCDDDELVLEGMEFATSRCDAGSGRLRPALELTVDGLLLEEDEEDYSLSPYLPGSCPAAVETWGVAPILAPVPGVEFTWSPTAHRLRQSMEVEYTDDEDLSSAAADDAGSGYEQYGKGGGESRWEEIEELRTGQRAVAVVDKRQEERARSPLSSPSSDQDGKIAPPPTPLSPQGSLSQQPLFIGVQESLGVGSGAVSQEDDREELAERVCTGGVAVREDLAMDVLDESASGDGAYTIPRRLSGKETLGAVGNMAKKGSGSMSNIDDVLEQEMALGGVNVSCSDGKSVNGRLDGLSGDNGGKRDGLMHASAVELLCFNSELDESVALPTDPFLFDAQKVTYAGREGTGGEPGAALIGNGSSVLSRSGREARVCGTGNAGVAPPLSVMSSRVCEAGIDGDSVSKGNWSDLHEEKCSLHKGNGLQLNDETQQPLQGGNAGLTMTTTSHRLSHVELVERDVALPGTDEFLNVSESNCHMENLKAVKAIVSCRSGQQAGCTSQGMQPTLSRSSQESRCAVSVKEALSVLGGVVQVADAGTQLHGCSWRHGKRESSRGNGKATAAGGDVCLGLGTLSSDSEESFHTPPTSPHGDSDEGTPPLKNCSQERPMPAVMNYAIEPIATVDVEHSDGVLCCPIEAVEASSGSCEGAATPSMNGDSSGLDAKPLEGRGPVGQSTEESLGVPQSIAASFLLPEDVATSPSISAYKGAEQEASLQMCNAVGVDKNRDPNIGVKEAASGGSPSLKNFDVSSVVAKDDCSVEAARNPIQNPRLKPAFQKGFLNRPRQQRHSPREKSCTTAATIAGKEVQEGGSSSLAPLSNITGSPSSAEGEASSAMKMEVVNKHTATKGGVSDGGGVHSGLKGIANGREGNGKSRAIAGGSAMKSLATCDEGKGSNAKGLVNGGEQDGVMAKGELLQDGQAVGKGKGGSGNGNVLRSPAAKGNVMSQRQGAVGIGAKAIGRTDRRGISHEHNLTTADLGKEDDSENRLPLTPHEMRRLTGKVVSAVAKVEKNKPNDPCPCKSGLKWKKCCGKGGKPGSIEGSRRKQSV